jgi:putative ABC transport system permease protein
MDALINDLRYAARRLVKSPGFTSVALVTLALALGANTAIYSVVDALMIKPLPYRDPGRLTELAGLTRDGLSNVYFTVDQFTEWRALTTVFGDLQAYTNRPATIAGDGEPETLLGAALTGGMMRMLGVQPSVGRGLAESDAHAGRDHVVVLSEDIWRRRFGADPKALGKTIRLDDQPYTIVGVMPRAFNFPYGQRQFWIPLALDGPVTPASPRISLIGRVRDGLTMKEAQARMDVVSSALVADKRHPAGWKTMLGQLTAGHLNPPVRRALYVLSGAVVLVLLIACANVANLLLLQGGVRRREVAVRAALGASRARLLRQLLTETLLLAIVGGLAGLLLAEWAIDLLSAYTPKAMTFLSINDIALNGRVLAFAGALTMCTAALFGLLPAFRSAGDGPLTALAQGSRTATGAPRQERLRRVFVLAQLALSLMLLVGAGLLVRTFVHVTRHNVGFDPRDLVSMQISLPRNRYPTLEARSRFDRDVLAHVAAAPGVARASVEGGAPPVGGGISFSLKIDVEGKGTVLDDSQLILPFNNVDPGYFDLMRIPVRRGRVFNANDTAVSPKVIILSESFAQRLWHGADPVGQRVRFDPEDPWFTVVGVVGDVYQFRHEELRDQFSVYYPVTQNRYATAYRMLVVRTAGEPASVVAAVKRAVWAVDPLQPIANVQTLDAAYAEFLSVPRFYAWLMGVFAAIGLAIACIGLYGVLSYATAQRTREFGIRIALGASSRDVLALVMRGGVAMTLAGIVAGVLGSLAVTRVLQSLLIDVSRTDVWTYCGVSGLLVAIALGATWVPAHRAARTDPAVTLRYD